MVFVMKSNHYGNGNENVAIEFSVQVGAIVLSLMFRGCFVDLVVLCFTTFAIPACVENRGTIICISALKSITTSQNCAFL